MPGSPKKRQRREAAAARAAGSAPSVFIDGETPPAPPAPRTMSLAQFEEEGRKAHVKYSPEVAAELIEAVSCGVALADYCAGPNRPSRRTVVQWKSAHPGFSQALHEARLFRAESRADIIDQLLQDMESGKLDPIAGRAIVDGHKWLMAKENVRYSDVQKVELSGRDGGPISVLEMGGVERVELARFASFVLRLGAEASDEIAAEHRKTLELTVQEKTDG